MNVTRRVTLFRRLSQIAFFALTGEWLFVGWLRCPFSVPYVSCTACPLTDCPGRWLQLPILGAILASALAGGRLFCGWGCPMGFCGEILGKLPKLRGIRTLRSRIFAAADRWGKLAKFAAPVVAIYLLMSYDLVSARPFAYVVRSASVFNLDAVGTAVALGSPQYAVRLWILAAVVVGSLLVTRFWCRYLCPLGGLLGLFNKISLVKIGRKSEELPHCSVYPSDCLQHTVPGTTDCVMCGECVEGCPRHNLAWQRRRLQIPEWLLPPVEAESTARVGAGE